MPYRSLRTRPSDSELLPSASPVSVLTARGKHLRVYDGVVGPVTVAVDDVSYRLKVVAPGPLLELRSTPTYQSNPNGTITAFYLAVSSFCLVETSASAERCRAVAGNQRRSDSLWELFFHLPIYDLVPSLRHPRLPLPSCRHFVVTPSLAPPRRHKRITEMGWLERTRVYATRTACDTVDAWESLSDGRFWMTVQTHSPCSDADEDRQNGEHDTAPLLDSGS